MLHCVLQIEAGNITLTFPIYFNPVTWDQHIFPVFFGGTEVSADRAVVSAPSMQMVYFVAVDTPRQIQMYVGGFYFTSFYYETEAKIHSSMSNGFILFSLLQAILRIVCKLREYNK